MKHKPWNFRIPSNQFRISWFMSQLVVLSGFWLVFSKFDPMVHAIDEFHHWSFTHHFGRNIFFPTTWSSCKSKSCFTWIFYYIVQLWRVLFWKSTWRLRKVVLLMFQDLRLETTERMNQKLTSNRSNYCFLSLSLSIHMSTIASQPPPPTQTYPHQ